MAEHTMEEGQGGVDQEKRALLALTVGFSAAAAAGTLVPFVRSMLPSDRARALGAPVEVGISSISPGELKVVEWRGKPVWVLHRTPAMLEALQKTDFLRDPQSQGSLQPAYTKNPNRAVKPEWLVLIGVCTHLGCSPLFKPEGQSGMGPGFFCPCHGSKFDLAGRVYKGVPAPSNLEVPPYRFADGSIVVGENPKEA